MRGWFAIGIEHTKTETNVGTLFRSAHAFGAAFVFTIGRRYHRQASDTPQTWKHIPLIHFSDLDAFQSFTPFDAPLVGVELLPEAKPLASYTHSERAIYLLGAEDHGLSAKASALCHHHIILPGTRCLNVSVAGSIVMCHRVMQRS